MNQKLAQDLNFQTLLYIRFFGRGSFKKLKKYDFILFSSLDFFYRYY